jgi:nucleoside-diphosphate-sugar epimerase
MANVLVRGRAGCVGSHVHNHLKTAGPNPVVCDVVTRGFGELASPHGVPHVDGTLSNRALRGNMLAENNIDTSKATQLLNCSPRYSNLGKIGVAAIACVGKQNHISGLARLTTGAAQ